MSQLEEINLALSNGDIDKAKAAIKEYFVNAGHEIEDAQSADLLIRIAESGADIDESYLKELEGYLSVLKELNDAENELDDSLAIYKLKEDINDLST